MVQACCLSACTPIFEARLLPKLDVQTQLNLAATSQELRHWLLTLPPSFWQLQARVLLIHLGSLEQTTLLAAVQALLVSALGPL